MAAALPGPGPGLPIGLKEVFVIIILNIFQICQGTEQPGPAIWATVAGPLAQWAGPLAQCGAKIQVYGLFFLFFLFICMYTCLFVRTASARFFNRLQVWLDTFVLCIFSLNWPRYVRCLSVCLYTPKANFCDDQVPKDWP